MEQTRLLHGKPASSPELNARSVLPTAEQLEESAILAHCQLGVRAVLAPLIGTYLSFWSGLGLTIILSLLRCLLIISPSHMPPWLCVIPLLVGCGLGFFTHLRSFNRLRVFLFVPPPPDAHLSRAAFASSRREKIPFALLWLRFSAQTAAGSLAVLFSGVLLASHFEEAASVDLSIALAPLAVFATLNVFHGLLCKGGSWLRLFGACAALAQLWLLVAPTSSSDPITHIETWNQRLLPSYVMLALMTCMLLRHLFVYHSWHMSTTSSSGSSSRFVSSITCVQDAAHRMRALSPPQACVGWTYLIGSFLSLAGLYCFAHTLDDFDNEAIMSGSSRWRTPATACVLFLSIGGALFVVGGWAAVVRWAAVLEVYTGDQDPLPVYQDTESGEWGVPGEESLCIEAGGVDGCAPASAGGSGGCGIQSPLQHAGDYTSCCGCTDPSCLAPHVEGAVHWWRTAIAGWAPELEEAPLLGPHPTRFSYAQTDEFSLRQATRTFGGSSYFASPLGSSSHNNSTRAPTNPYSTERGNNSAVAAVVARTALGRAAGGLPLNGQGQAPLGGSYQRSGGDVRI